mmetsp:Transcript_28589/g.21351  ORF Transcript_28589/g.21351 Transcript_28589/m.21351 type:complete len:108 (+) Transcript_28589:110-433(+)
MKSNSINDEEIRRSFESYTMLVMDFAFREGPVRHEDIPHDSERLSDVIQSRVKRFQKTSLFQVQQFLMRVRDFDLKEGVSFGQVERTLRKLRVAREVSHNEDTLQMF